ncbi:hypothetical protein EON71_00460 [bacterium]|nr:MAG: hypothetical protein EON71_00460 [bacterium]
MLIYIYIYTHFTTNNRHRSKKFTRIDSFQLPLCHPEVHEQPSLSKNIKRIVTPYINKTQIFENRFLPYIRQYTPRVTSNRLDVLKTGGVSIETLVMLRLIQCPHCDSSQSEILCANLPTTIKNLIIRDESFDINFENLNLHSLEVCNDKFKRKIPSCLKKLTLGNHIDVDISKYEIPHGLTHLKFGRKYNSDCYLPDNLTHLTFGSDFNQYIKEYPKNLTQLWFGCKFNQPIVKLPMSLRDLRFGMRFNQNICNILPPQLLRVQFGSHFNCDLNNLPDSIQFLSIGIIDDYYKPHVLLKMADIQGKEFTYETAYSHKFTKLPSNLLYAILPDFSLNGFIPNFLFMNVIYGVYMPENSKIISYSELDPTSLKHKHYSIGVYGYKKKSNGCTISRHNTRCTELY